MFIFYIFFFREKESIFVNRCCLCGGDEYRAAGSAPNDPLLGTTRPLKNRLLHSRAYSGVSRERASGRGAPSCVCRVRRLGYRCTSVEPEFDLVDEHRRHLAVTAATDTRHRAAAPLLPLPRSTAAAMLILPDIKLQVDRCHDFLFLLRLFVAFVLCVQIYLRFPAREGSFQRPQGSGRGVVC